MITRRLCSYRWRIITRRHGMRFAERCRGRVCAALVYLNRDMRPPSGGRVFACHGYGCSRRLPVMFDGNIIPRAAALLVRLSRPEAETAGLGEIVRIYTAQLARELGGAPDRPGSPPANVRATRPDGLPRRDRQHHKPAGRTRQSGSACGTTVSSARNRGAFSSTAVTHISRRSLRRRKAVASGRSIPWRYAPGKTPDILPLSQWRQDS